MKLTYTTALENALTLAATGNRSFDELYSLTIGDRKYTMYHTSHKGVKCYGASAHVHPCHRTDMFFVVADNKIHVLEKFDDGTLCDSIRTEFHWNNWSWDDYETFFREHFWSIIVEKDRDLDDEMTDEEVFQFWLNMNEECFFSREAEGDLAWFMKDFIEYYM